MAFWTDQLKRIRDNTDNLFEYESLRITRKLEIVICTSR